MSDNYKPRPSSERAKKKASNTRVYPEPTFFPLDQPEDDDFLRALRASSTQALLRLNYCGIDPKMRVDQVIDVRHAGGQIAYLEVKMVPRDSVEAMNPSNKRYHTVYSAHIEGSDDQALNSINRPDGATVPPRYYNEMKPLAEEGLFIPTNAPAICEAITANRRSEEPRGVYLVICEGEKARRAMEKRLGRPDALAWADEHDILFLTTAWVQGLSGARMINWNFAPSNRASSTSRVDGVNDFRLDYARDIACIFIAQDNDPAGRQEADITANRLIDLFDAPPKHVRIIPPAKNAPARWDDADPLPLGVTEEMRFTQIIGAPVYERIDWMSKANSSLIVNKHNGLLIMKNTEEFKGAFAFNTVTMQPMLLKALPTSPPGDTYPRDFRDSDYTDIQMMIERTKLRPGFEAVPDNIVRAVVDQFILSNRINPLREHLEALPKWDGVPRIETFFENYCGVDASEYPDGYLSMVGRCHFVGTAARWDRPGCKMDTAVALWGPMGFRKSTLCYELARGIGAIDPNDAPYYSDTPPEIGKGNARDSAIHVVGKGVIEMPEGAAIKNRERIEHIKSYMSTAQDTYRPMYGRHTIKYPRHCVHIITTNNERFLTDRTGNRRIMPVHITQAIDVDRIRADRDQIYAEAFYLFKSGTPWWTSDEETQMLAAVSEENLEEDIFETRLFRGGRLEPLVGEENAAFHIDDVYKCLQDEGLRYSSINLAEALRLQGFINMRTSVRSSGVLRKESRWLWSAKGSHRKPTWGDVWVRWVYHPKTFDREIGQIPGFWEPVIQEHNDSLMKPDPHQVEALFSRLQNYGREGLEIGTRDKNGLT